MYSSILIRKYCYYINEKQRRERLRKTVPVCYFMDSFACVFETQGFAPQWLVRNALRYACGLRSAAHCK